MRGGVNENGVAGGIAGCAMTLGIAAIVGAENCATAVEDSGDIVECEIAGAIFDEAGETITDADDTEVVLVNGGLRDRTYDRIEAGAIAAASEDADGFDGFGCWRLRH